MRFYYISIFSLIFLAVTYLVVFGVFWFFWTKALKRKFSGPVVWVIGALILVAPWTEELWIAYNFGQLCQKDAGIFINKTVEADGYYDATAGLRQIYNPLPDVTSQSFDERGFKFYEFSMADPRGGRSKVAHFEKVDGKWVGKILDKPEARYYYRWPHSHTTVAYKIKLHEWIVEDVERHVVLAKEKAYAREAYWFYVGLDRPTLFCPVFGNHGERLTGGLYRLVLKPSR